ncbi:glycosyltransferase family 10 domain-containing protein [Butyrivibrio proteoclasticus]|uniref:glycosyltransferase family 10 domain-containing protein n=1 Tax=Butyrivibrio proteoclasticus TaxID=43305 RepID=UPI000479ED7F|nr:glycosyltransferase family 10 [Butyrivibrio proteoclasticus]
MTRQVKVKFVDSIKKQARLIRELLSPEIELVDSDNPDYLFYSVFNSLYEHYDKKYDNCTKIFLASEATIPDFNECDYAIGEYPMVVGDRYFQKPYIAPQKSDKFDQEIDNSYFNRKFCNFIYSNESNGNGAVLRKEFCQALMKYKNVDCPGQVLNNMKDAIEPRSGKWAVGKREFIKNYKFTIAFENVNTPGMVSEKILDAFKCKSVPIYWGPKDVYNIYNSEAFIDCSGLTIPEMVEKVIEIDQDDEKYLKMLKANPINPKFDFDWEIRMKEFLIDILDGNRPKYFKNALGRDAGTNAANELLEIDNTFWMKCHRFKKMILTKLKRLNNKFKR